MLELYHNDMSTCAQKVRATLAEKELAWDGHELNLRTGEQHKPQFLKLNPRGVVPVLVHDGSVINESNIIMEYLEDAFPDTKRLMPKSAIGRAVVRNLLQRLDTALHLNIATISVGVAFRDQLLAVHKSDQALEFVLFSGARSAPSGRVSRRCTLRRGVAIVPAGARRLEAAACRYEQGAGVGRLARR